MSEESEILDCRICIRELESCSLLTSVQTNELQSFGYSECHLLRSSLFHFQLHLVSVCVCAFSWEMILPHYGPEKKHVRGFILQPAFTE